ncbi:hypothetical protein Clacol_010435 [Clathrus columnatus]|uniref:Uncharacterized protein n=1 Tax=Clathrus columnatus TaxID=1419009 RepID=A0AAV5ANU4_9AGAM|nr:hypothetical protein Clacol_010435 [Clathrus columnatus]
MAPPSLSRTKRRIKRTRVSPKLYLELSEYASLLRSMRINDTSDLVGELIRYGKRKRDEIHQEVDEDEYQNKRSRKILRTQHPPELGETAQPLPPKRRKPKRKDTYTLWPLFPEHCPIPEFSFEEEVIAVAEEWMRNRVGGQNLGSDNGESESENVDRPNENTALKDDLQIQLLNTTLPTSQTNPLIPSSIIFLRTLLSTLAFHRVGSATAPQSHGKPMTWIDVLEITASDGALGLGLKDPEVIERIQTRLCEIYGDHNRSIAPQISLAISKSKTTLREMDQKFQTMIFENCFFVPVQTILTFVSLILAGTVVSQKQFKSTKRPVQDDGSNEEEEGDRDESESGSGSEQWKGENEHEDGGLSDDDEEMENGNGNDANDEDNENDELDCDESGLSDLKPGKLKSTSRSASTPTSASQTDSDSKSDVGDNR